MSYNGDSKYIYKGAGDDWNKYSNNNYISSEGYEYFRNHTCGYGNSCCQDCRGFNYNGWDRNPSDDGGTK